MKQSKKGQHTESPPKQISNIPRENIRNIPDVHENGLILCGRQAGQCPYDNQGKKTSCEELGLAYYCKSNGLTQAHPTHQTHLTSKAHPVHKYISSNNHINFITPNPLPQTCQSQTKKPAK